MPDGFRHGTGVETQFPLEEKISTRSHQRSELLDRTRGPARRRTMRPPSVLTAKIKTNAIWARIIRNCLLSPASRYIPSRFSSRSASMLASILFKLQLYAAQKVEKLEISIEAWPLFLLRSLSLLYAFYILNSFSPSLSLSLHLARFRLCLVTSPEISSLPARSLFFSSSASPSQPLSLPAYKRFD